MQITAAEFVKSAVSADQYPQTDLPEIAFAGRSNVGKSSLINVLVNRKRLAKTSNTPGRTQLLNFFLVNKAFRMVDLPGYGFAKVPSGVRRQWAPMVEAYLRSRPCLSAVILILDIRRQPQSEESQLLEFLRILRLPCALVLNKIDKLSRSQYLQRRSKIAVSLSLPIDDFILFSAKSRQGRIEVLHFIERMIGQPASAAGEVHQPEEPRL